jgi:hypothetical protein
VSIGRLRNLTPSAALFRRRRILTFARSVGVHADEGEDLVGLEADAPRLGRSDASMR